MRYRLTEGSRAEGKASIADAEEWCAGYRGKPSRRKRYTDMELAALARRCGLEGRCGTRS